MSDYPRMIKVYGELASVSGLRISVQASFRPDMVSLELDSIPQQNHIWLAREEARALHAALGLYLEGSRDEKA